MAFGCLFFPAFSVWAFRRSARDRRPLVVVHAGKVVAASRRATHAGIAPGMAAERVTALLPEAHVCTRDRSLERAAWEEVLQALNTLTPFIEPATPGLAYFGDAVEEALASLVRGFGASAGIAPARSFARLAAVKAAPGHTLPVRPADVEAFLGRLPMSLLAALGFEEDLTERLILLGYADLHRASALSRRHLSAQFGKEGTRLYDLLHPPEEAPVALYTPPPAVRASYDFDWPATDPGEVVPVLHHLAEEAARGLGAGRCRRVKLSLQLSRMELPRFTCRVLPEAVGEPRRLAQTALTLLVELMHPGEEAAAVTLELGALQAARAVQPSLFFTRPTVFAAVRAIEQKFPGAMLRARITAHTLFCEEAVQFEPFPLEMPAPRRGRKHR